MPCSADTSCIQSYSVHSHTLLVWALFPYTRGQGPGWYCALLYISVWQVKNSTIVLSHGGHRALLLEKHYLYFRSEWFTMCSIWNLQHTSPHSEFPYHYNFSFHMFKQMLMNEFISVGSCTWLPPEDPQCSGFYDNSGLPVTLKWDLQALVKQHPQKSVSTLFTLFMFLSQKSACLVSYDQWE